MQPPTVWNIDCDVLLYAVGFACQDKETEADACDQLHKKIIHIMNRLPGCEKAELFLTGEGNYREAIALTDYPYKGNRSAPKPTLYPALKSFAIDELDAIVWDGMEADDALAHYAVHRGDGIATIDKDLSMVPGWHYNWNKDKVRLISPEAGLTFFYRQLLTGDSTDNIPGLFKLTGKKAMAKIKDPLSDMDNEQDMWDYVLGVYEEAGLEDVRSVLTVIGTQLWMDYNWEQEWLPPDARG